MLRIAETKDLSALAELEQTFAFPLSEEELKKLMQNQTFRVMVWEEDGKILGHCVLFRVMDEAEITSVSVKKEWRGQGIGKALISALLDYLRADGAKIAYLDVRESNAAARALYQTCGFTEIGRRKRFYQKPTEDAIGMGIEL